MSTCKQFLIGATRIQGIDLALWKIGWNPTVSLFASIFCAVIGTILIQNKAGALLGLLGALIHLKALRFVQRQAPLLIEEAQCQAQLYAANHLGIEESQLKCFSLATPQGESPLGISFQSSLFIVNVILAKAYVVITPSYLFNLPRRVLQVSDGGQEVYFRHINNINYCPPIIEIRCSNVYSIQLQAPAASDSEVLLKAFRLKISDSEKLAV